MTADDSFAQLALDSAHPPSDLSIPRSNDAPIKQGRNPVR